MLNSIGDKLSPARGSLLLRFELRIIHRTIGNDHLRAWRGVNHYTAAVSTGVCAHLRDTLSA